MTQVVYLNRVEVILAPYQIPLLIASFKPLLIHQLTGLRGSVVVRLISTLIRH